MAEAQHMLFGDRAIQLPGGGPRYLQRKRVIEDAVSGGQIRAGDALPSERDLAAKMDVSRVTVRKAVQHLVREGILVQRHGSGTYVAPQPSRVEQSLSQLTSFTEDMARRGMLVSSTWLDRGLYPPSPEEMGALGVSASDSVARVARLRLAGNMPLAIERAALSSRTLPDTEHVGTSLYDPLEEYGKRPVRAIQRIRAISLGDDDARLLGVSPGVASLHIERISYLGSGRVVVAQADGADALDGAHRPDDG